MYKIICPFCGAENYTASPRCMSACCECGKEFALEPRMDLTPGEREERRQQQLKKEQEEKKQEEPEE